MDELNPHYAAMVEEMHVGGGYCVKYDLDFCHGSIRDSADQSRVHRFETWIEAYDAAVRQFDHYDHMAADPDLVAA